MLVVKCTQNYNLLLGLDGRPWVLVSSRFEIPGLETKDVHLFLCKNSLLVIYQLNSYTAVLKIDNPYVTFTGNTKRLLPVINSLKQH